MPDQSFDWQTDLIEIIQPIFQSLKDLTEQPRAIERIRKTIEFYQQNLVEINDSIQKIQEWQSEQIVDLSARQQIKARHGFGCSKQYIFISLIAQQREESKTVTVVGLA